MAEHLRPPADPDAIQIPGHPAPDDYAYAVAGGFIPCSREIMVDTSDDFANRLVNMLTESLDRAFRPWGWWDSPPRFTISLFPRWERAERRAKARWAHRPQLRIVRVDGCDE